MTVSEHRNSAPVTLFHGDVHLENILYSPVPEARPILIDWQLAGRGLGANDVSYFLVGSLSVSDRRAHECELLRHYFEKLVFHLCSQF